MRKWIWVGDTHGDMIDDEWVSRLEDFIHDFKPDFRGHGGDIFDFAALRKGASKSERAQKVEDDVAAGKQFLALYQPDVVLLGNHDDRLWEIAEQNADGFLEAAARMAVDDIEDELEHMGATIVPYHARDGVYRMGDLSVLHGYHHGRYAAARHADVYGNCMVFHVHSFQTMPVKSLAGGNCHHIGCGCKVWQGYNKKQTNTMMHSRGWAYGYHNEKTGSVVVYRVEDIDGELIWN